MPRNQDTWEAYLNLSKVFLDLTWPWRFEYIWGLMKYIWHLIISSSFHFQNTISIISVLRYNIKCPQCNYRMIQAFLSALIRKTTSSGYIYHVLMILKAFEILKSPSKPNGFTRPYYCYCFLLTGKFRNKRNGLAY